jgi:hypothetical protein
MGVNAIAAHTRHYPNHLHSPYFSPALPSPDGSPRFSHLTQSQGKAGGKEEKKGTKVYVQAGTAELLWDQAKMLCRGMREEGVDVTLREVRRCAFVSPFLLVRDEAARSYANIRRDSPLTTPTIDPFVLWAIVCDYGTRSIGSRGYPRGNPVQPGQTAQGDSGGPARVLERSRLESNNIEVARPSGYSVCSLHNLAPVVVCVSFVMNDDHVSRNW